MIIEQLGNRGQLIDLLDFRYPLLEETDQRGVIGIGAINKDAVESNGVENFRQIAGLFCALRYRHAR